MLWPAHRSVFVMPLPVYQPIRTDVTADLHFESRKTKLGANFRLAPQRYEWTNETTRPAHFHNRLTVNCLVLRAVRNGSSWYVNTHTHTCVLPSSPPPLALSCLSSALTALYTFYCPWYVTKVPSFSPLATACTHLLFIPSDIWTWKHQLINKGWTLLNPLSCLPVAISTRVHGAVTSVTDGMASTARQTPRVAASTLSGTTGST